MGVRRSAKTEKGTVVSEPELVEAEKRLRDIFVAPPS
jgi:hypothetical protein